MGIALRGNRCDVEYVWTLGCARTSWQRVFATRELRERESLAGTGVEDMGIRRAREGFLLGLRTLAESSLVAVHVWCLLQWWCDVDVSLALSGIVSSLLGAWCAFAREASAEVGRAESQRIFRIRANIEKWSFRGVEPFIYVGLGRDWPVLVFFLVFRAAFGGFRFQLALEVSAGGVWCVAGLCSQGSAVLGKCHLEVGRCKVRLVGPATS